MTEHQWQCLVRQVLAWRAEKGEAWRARWLAELAQKQGAQFAKDLADECTRQWSKGNRGKWGEWK